MPVHALGQRTPLRVVDPCPRMAREQAPQEEKHSSHHSPLEDHLLAERGAGRLVATVAVREERTQRPVIGRQRRLVDADERHKQLAGQPGKVVRRIAHAGGGQ